MYGCRVVDLESSTDDKQSDSTSYGRSRTQSVQCPQTHSSSWLTSLIGTAFTHQPAPGEGAGFDSTLRRAENKRRPQSWSSIRFRPEVLTSEAVQKPVGHCDPQYRDRSGLGALASVCAAIFLSSFRTSEPSHDAWARHCRAGSSPKSRGTSTASRR